MDAPPLIITLALNAAAEQFFNVLRQQHFPPDRNFLAAHLTLFHHLPSDESKIFDDVIKLGAQQKKFALQVIDVVSIGNGVAYKIKSETLHQLHKDLQQHWQSWLTPQDKQKLWPHVTIQNKVAPQTALDLLQNLKPSFVPWEVQATGLRLWRYVGGPWELLHEILFQD